MTRDEIEKQIDGLYQLPPKEFIQARRRLADELAAAGERARGSLVRDLPKPSTSAWVVDQLWFQQKAAFQALLETGKRLRAAQQGVLAGRGAQAMQKAMADERRALAVLLDEARALLGKAGLGPASVALERAKTTLQAISRSPDSKFAGRLAHDLELPGLAALVGSASDEEEAAGQRAPARVAPEPRTAKAKARKVPRADLDQRRAETATKEAVGRNRQRAKAALREASNAVKLAEGRRRQAEKQQAATKRILDRLDAELDRLEAERRRVENQRATARRNADAAARETARIDQDLEASAVALEEAKQRHAQAQRTPTRRKRDRSHSD